MAKQQDSEVWGSLDPCFETGPVIGRKVANAGFLRALLAADPFDTYPSSRLESYDVFGPTALGRAILRGQDFSVVLAALEGQIDVHLMRAILIWTRHGLAWEAIQIKASPQEARVLRVTLMWMLKGGMLEQVRD